MPKRPKESIEHNKKRTKISLSGSFSKVKNNKNKAPHFFNKRIVSEKLVPQNNSFASVSLVFKQKRKLELEKNEFQYLLATAIQSLHGEIANQADVLSFKTIDEQNYEIILKFKSIHCFRVITSLLLFGAWQGSDCKFEIKKVAQTPCFLSII